MQADGMRPQRLSRHTSAQRGGTALPRVLFLASPPIIHPPQGAMYLMVGFEPSAAIPSDVELSQLLLREENVSVLPGTVRRGDRRRGSLPVCMRSSEVRTLSLPPSLHAQAFNIANFVRIVFCAPETVLLEAAGRIAQFMARHFPQTPRSCGRDVPEAPPQAAAAPPVLQASAAAAGAGDATSS